MANGSPVITDFRIGTVNVHSFRHPETSKSNAKELASILGPLNLDVLAVEEAMNDYDWKLLCNDLSLTHSVFGASHGVSYGNAIASRHPIVEHFKQKSKIDADGGYRAMLRCRFGGYHPFVQNRRFAVTHLDHLNEDDRLTQIKEFSPHNHDINVLFGDMNALTQNDYSDKYFGEIVAGKREKAGWEIPRFELTQLLTNTWSFQDAFRDVNPKLKDEQVATCPYGTRIDYIFLHPLSKDEWLLKECFIVDTYQATDHHAVVATFEHKSKSENNIENDT
ncbi:unnamed protein product [Rotaria sordida]|uniref:Endonuclease/exonuclease/phosphatase domain-containing protein n=1 Tax=Rotaria sordida TaxID=392033 RepID=A0A813SAX0_9BILA|nr:unnamed protein product [Rotaria sordida]CAF0827264.1 unnamed protein product [Rotaria sordida]CAF0867018.1 unnamed protein product [Rotaria sordida]CAF0870959.1 unnamed protein product [Rotaria sordida]CAF3496922.1 unnamed protein product [Rotaria sordida]